MKILVTGGCGYIGLHTIVDLIQNGHSVVSIDNNSRSTNYGLRGIKKITGQTVKNYKIDLCNLVDVQSVFNEHKDIDCVIHFAAYKSVEESTKNPLMYFENNINSLITVLKCIKEFNIAHFIFSSSCSVYGNPDVLPLTEDSLLKSATSPYGATKQIGEDIIRYFLKVSNVNVVLLRYFNVAGAHPSLDIGPYLLERPQSLVSNITRFAVGKLENLYVYGNDYPTRDGSCVRDFFHVCDLAHAHTLAVNFLKKDVSKCEIFNLGMGRGITVLEAINIFQQVNAVELKYTRAPRREGDCIEVYTDNSKAKNVLGWELNYSIEDVMKTEWEWEKRNI